MKRTFAARRRPISLKLVANKHTMLVMSAALQRAIVKWSTPQQRGFIPSRNLCVNIIEADALARECSLTAAPDSHPSLWALDLEAAFPSIARLWIFYALEAMRAPAAFVAFVRATHSSTWALSLTQGGLVFQFELASGVEQGCPSASYIFIFAFEACVRMLTMAIATTGAVLACADDLLLIIKAICVLNRVAAIFCLLEKAAALRLAAHKCCAVPLWARFSPHVAEVLRVQICRVAPSLAKATISGSTVFLGILVGPSATPSAIWKPALDKFRKVVL